MRVSKPATTEIRAEVLEQHRKARERSENVAKAILRGEIQVPLRCERCRSPSLTMDDEFDPFGAHRPTIYVCLQCGSKTRSQAAHAARRAEMKMIIQAGVDPRFHQRGA